MYPTANLLVIWNKSNLTHRHGEGDLLWYERKPKLKYVNWRLLIASRFFMERWGMSVCTLLSLPWLMTNCRHKDYLFQKKLAKALPIDSFRFDFR